MKNDCFRVCLIFHFINRFFALSGSSISLYFSGTSMVVVVFSYNKVLLNIKRLFFFIYNITIRSFLIFTPVYQLDTLRSITFIVSFVVSEMINQLVQMHESLILKLRIE